MAKKTAPPAPFAHRPPAITILSDHATQDRGPDSLGNDDIAWLADKDQLQLESRLASTFDILRHKNTRCPLAVAVYGDWGTGKTSAMRWLETRLREWNAIDKIDRKGHPRAYPVWFDPWRYHTKEEVWRGIIAEVILAILHVGHLDGENLLPRMVQAVKKFGGFLGRSFIHAVANMEFEAGSKAKVPGLAEGEVKFTAKGEMFRDIWEEYDKTAHPHKAHLNLFEDTLRTWVTDFLGPQVASDDKAFGIAREPARLVLFIDDLDRCMPEVALEVIEALKLYLNIDHLVFVVGLDETVVSAVVAEHYRKSGVDIEKARRYLDKVFQVDIRIPPSEAVMADYMRTQIDALNKATGNFWHDIMERSGHRETLENVLIKLARNNPREVKRLLNSALLRGRAASLDATLTPSTEQGPVQNVPADAEAERFAQGVQVFLLQRLIADRLLQSDDLLIYNHHLTWFTQASEKVRSALKFSGQTWEDFKQSVLDCESAEGELGMRKIGIEINVKNKTSALSDDCLRALTELHAHLTGAPPKTGTPLWTDELFLCLLQVPFSQAIASHFPPLRSAAPTPALLKLESLSDFLRERLASAASVPVTELKIQHLSNVTQLDLSGTPVTGSQLYFLTGLPSLVQLNLSQCIELQDIDPLAGLHNLGRLNLTDCTGLNKDGALRCLSKMESLWALDLSGCTWLKNTAALSELHKLEKLYLRNCTSLKSAKALEALYGLEKLRRLDLKGCSGLNQAAIRTVRSKLVKECMIFGPNGIVMGTRQLS